MKTYKGLQEKWEQDNLCIYAKKSAEAKRWKVDIPNDYKTEYQRDAERILFSDEFRRLRMKTQVFAASGVDQHNRTRLTHSLEVSQIAKDIARPLRLNTDLTEAISLAHDLGHTPFGHAGESALNECLVARGKGTFHHNVQSVWILQTFLKSRVDINGKPYPGFNLTYDVVEGVWKHTDYKNTVSEYSELKNLHPNSLPSLEGQVVDLADGLAYIKHDIDDAVRMKIIEKDEFIELWRSNTDIPFDNRWIEVFVKDIISTSLNKNVICQSEDIEKLYRVLKKFLNGKILSSEKVKSSDDEGKNIVSTLFDYYMKNPEYMKKKYPRRYDYLQLKVGEERIAVDLIQWFGDELAKQEYRKIKRMCQL